MAGRVCGRRSRPGRPKAFVQMGNTHGDVGMSGLLLSRVGDHPRCQPCLYLHVSCGGPCSPAWHHRGPCPLACLSSSSPPAGVPTSLSARGDTAGKMQELHNTVVCTRAHFTLWEPFSDPGSRLRTLVIRPSQAVGTQTPGC